MAKAQAGCELHINRIRGQTLTRGPDGKLTFEGQIVYCTSNVNRTTTWVKVTPVFVMNVLGTYFGRVRERLVRYGRHSFAKLFTLNFSRAKHTCNENGEPYVPDTRKLCQPIADGILKLARVFSNFKRNVEKQNLACMAAQGRRRRGYPCSAPTDSDPAACDCLPPKTVYTLNFATSHESASHGSYTWKAATLLS